MHPVITFPGSSCYGGKRNANDSEVNQSDLQIQIWYNITAIFHMNTNIQGHTSMWGGWGVAMSLAEVDNVGTLQSFHSREVKGHAPLGNLGNFRCF